MHEHGSLLARPWQQRAMQHPSTHFPCGPASSPHPTAPCGCRSCWWGVMSGLISPFPQGCGDPSVHEELLFSPLGEL